MNNSGVRIEYGNIAPEAKENFEASANEKKFNTLNQLKEYNVFFPNYTNPCEFYQTALDGNSNVIPYETENIKVGLWSNQISLDDGTFSTPIILTLISNGKYSSPGLTFTFDTHNNIFATNMNIQWYQDDNLISQMDFYPDNSKYSCYNDVQLYNKIIITFYSINMPLNRLKLRVIDYGTGIIFLSKNLRNVKLIQEINPISSEIAISTADFTLDIEAETDLSFQNKQPLSVYYNGQLKATTFVQNFKRKSKNIWDFQTEDYIGLMNEITFYGRVYDGKPAFHLLQDIFDVAKVPYDIDSRIRDLNLTVKGHLPIATCREALMQVAFAIQAVVDTSNSDKVRVYLLDDDIKQNIPLSRIMQGQNIQEQETITAIEIVSHEYIKPLDTDDEIELYNAEKSGIGENIIIKFSEPIDMLSFRIVNGSYNMLNNNFASINAEEGCLLVGKKYRHVTSSKTQKNENIPSSVNPKIVSIENATLVSSENVDKVLEKCYTYFTKTDSINMRIVDGKHVSGGEIYRYGQANYGAIKYGSKSPKIITYDIPTNVGQKISTQTDYSKKILTGTIIKQTFNLNGGIIIKDSVIK